MERRNGESCGADLKVPSMSQETCLNIPVIHLMLEPNLPEYAHKKTQNSKKGTFQLRSYPLNEGNTMENREFENSSVETSFNVTSNHIRPCTMSPSLMSTSVDEQVDSYLGLPMPGNLCWPYADGDFFRDRSERHMNSSSTTENDNGETLPPKCNLKYGDSNVEENLTDESDLSENEKANDGLLNYFKKMDLNLKPEKIDDVEESFTEEQHEIFLYPDFLPPPFNTLDLHKSALSKCESWKATAVEPPESSTEHLIARLLELERLQHMTIQKERPRLQTSCTSSVSERPSSSKVLSKMRQPKLSNTLSFQTSSVDKSQENGKNNSNSGKLEENASKWKCKYKWNSRPPSQKSSFTTKKMAETYDSKNPQSSTVNPCQELSHKPTTTQTTPSLVKVVSRRYTPTRSPIHIKSVSLSFPENHREESKASRFKKNLYQRTILMKRPFYIQKLNCLSPSSIAKCSPIKQNNSFIYSNVSKPMPISLVTYSLSL
ncbi:protein FAM217A [Ctenodactylus gundi]